MQRYILHRCLQGIVAFFVISIVVFLLARVSGDPRALLLPAEATKEQHEQVGRALGLDRPLPIQYGIWLGKVVQGDFGTSIRAKVPVSQLVAERLVNSAKLAGVAIGIAIFIGMFLGVIAALRKDTGIDTVAKVIAFVQMGIPSFWLGIMLILVFSVWLGWLPTSGMGGPKYYVLPAVTLGVGTVCAGIMRLTRSAILDVLDAEYIKFARIKGLSEPRVVLVHVLRNALIPVVTFAGIYFSLLIGMAVVVETVFNWPGIGRLTYEALIWRDFPIIQGTMLVIAGIVMVVNLIVDILYAYIDPRIRY